MKKRVFAVLAVFLILALSFSGCNRKNPNPANTTENIGSSKDQGAIGDALTDVSDGLSDIGSDIREDLTNMSEDMGQGMTAISEDINARP